jgi:hypothetical protein
MGEVHGARDSKLMQYVAPRRKFAKLLCPLAVDVAPAFEWTDGCGSEVTQKKTGVSWRAQRYSGSA